MHDCQKFREDWVAGSLQETGCDACRRFCQEADAVLTALGAASSPVPEASEPYWIWFENRLRSRLVDERTAAELRMTHYRWFTAVAAVAALALVLTWGSLRLPSPATIPTEDVRIEFDRDHIADLDPGVVDFLGQSELFVRDFTKIQASYTEDIADARDRASRNLARIALQKKAAGDFQPVRITLDEYESILRDIKNLESPQDITDIQTRIRRNGLIANLKAYQPRVVRVSQR
jgi:hypothetical protein